ncbi:MAG: hypothetical protein ACRESX_08115 [Gammaproteobacteria bacterium]
MKAAISAAVRLGRATLVSSFSRNPPGKLSARLAPAASTPAIATSTNSAQRPARFVTALCLSIVVTSSQRLCACARSAEGEASKHL